jgi:hypothetical protein
MKLLLGPRADVIHLLSTTEEAHTRTLEYGELFDFGLRQSLRIRDIILEPISALCPTPFAR